VRAHALKGKENFTHGAVVVSLVVPNIPDSVCSP